MRSKYDNLASHYDKRWRPYIEASLNEVLETMDLQGDEAVLDVPCGTGELEQRLLAEWPDLSITGVDISREMLAQAMIKEGASRVCWIEADVTEIPMPDQSVDRVICANSFHYFRTPNDALSEMRRVLRPDGRLVLLDWCDDYWACKACSLWLRLTDVAFHRTYPLKACVELVEENGFEIDRSRRFRINFPWGLLLLECHRTG